MLIILLTVSNSKCLNRASTRGSSYSSYGSNHHKVVFNMHNFFEKMSEKRRLDIIKYQDLTEEVCCIKKLTIWLIGREGKEGGQGIEVFLSPTKTQRFQKEQKT